MPRRGLLILLGLTLGLGAAGCAKPAKGQSPAAAGRPADNRPSIVIEGFHAQVHRDGVPQQEVRATWGHVDELANIIDMRQMQVRFYDPSAPRKLRGEARAGAGRIWLEDTPAEQAGRQDVLLSEKVLYSTPDGMLLQTPEMRYRAAQQLMSSDKGYVKQLPLKTGYFIGTGDRFEIKLRTDQSSFEKWTEYGHPATLKKSKTPVLKP